MSNHSTFQLYKQHRLSPSAESALRYAAVHLEEIRRSLRRNIQLTEYDVARRQLQTWSDELRTAIEVLKHDGAGQQHIRKDDE